MKEKSGKGKCCLCLHAFALYSIELMLTRYLIHKKVPYHHTSSPFSLPFSPPLLPPLPHFPMGGVSSVPRLSIDSKSLAFHLPPSVSFVALFSLTQSHQRKLREYNAEAPHHIAIRCKVLSGKLSSAFVTRDSLEGTKSILQSDITEGNTYSVILSSVSSDNFLLSEYFIHVENSSNTPCRVLFWAEVVRDSVGNAPERVRSLTVLPKDLPTIQHTQPRESSPSVSPAIAIKSMKSSGILSTLFPGVVGGEFTKIHLEDKAQAMQIDPFKKEWAAFTLTKHIQERVKEYNSTSPHSIALSFKVTLGSLTECAVYRDSPDGLIETVDGVNDKWTYLLKGEFTKGWEPSDYFFSLSTGESPAKVVISASIVQEVTDEKTGEIFIRHRGMTTTKEIIWGEGKTENINGNSMGGRPSSMGLSPVVGVVLSRASIRSSLNATGIPQKGIPQRPVGSVAVPSKSANGNGRNVPPSLREGSESDEVEMQVGPNASINHQIPSDEF